MLPSPQHSAPRLIKGKALSVKQPWAWAIFNSGKDVENRKWFSPYRGPLFIHASRTWDQEGYDWLSITFGGEFLMPSRGDYDFGVIIGKVDVIDCVDDHESAWFFGPYGFVFEDPIMFNKPIPYKGQRRIFDVEFSVTE